MTATTPSLTALRWQAEAALASPFESQDSMVMPGLVWSTLLTAGTDSSTV